MTNTLEVRATLGPPGPPLSNICLLIESGFRQLRFSELSASQTHLSLVLFCAAD